MVEKKKNRDKHSNKKEAHKDMYMDYRIRRKKQWLIYRHQNYNDFTKNNNYYTQDL